MLNTSHREKEVVAEKAEKAKEVEESQSLCCHLQRNDKPTLVYLSTCGCLLNRQPEAQRQF
jgi:hypothetical protein